MANLSAERKQELEHRMQVWRDAVKTVDVQRGRLQDLVLTAIDDDGARPSDVARAIGVSSTRIYSIITAAYRSR